MSADSEMVLIDSAEFDDIRRRIASALLEAAAIQRSVTGRECTVDVDVEWLHQTTWAGIITTGVRVRFRFEEL